MQWPLGQRVVKFPTKDDGDKAEPQAYQKLSQIFPTIALAIRGQVSLKEGTGEAELHTRGLPPPEITT